MFGLYDERVAWPKYPYVGLEKLRIAVNRSILHIIHFSLFIHIILNNFHVLNESLLF